MRSLRKAIDMKCKDCIYDPAVGRNWVKQVHECTAVSCPLWEVRRKSGARNAVEASLDADTALREE